MRKKQENKKKEGDTKTKEDILSAEFTHFKALSRQFVEYLREKGI